MHPVDEPGKMASWIAAPTRGINGLPDELVYASACSAPAIAAR